MNILITGNRIKISQAMKDKIHNMFSKIEKRHNIQTVKVHISLESSNSSKTRRIRSVMETSFHGTTVTGTSTYGEGCRFGAIRSSFSKLSKQLDDMSKKVRNKGKESIKNQPLENYESQPLDISDALSGAF